MIAFKRLEGWLYLPLKETLMDTNANLFLATTDRSLVRAARSEDGTWTVEPSLEGQDLTCLAADPLDPRVFYAGTRANGVLRSDDEGASWAPAGLEGQLVRSLAPSPHEPGLVYAGMKPAGIFVTRDGGQNWTELESFQRIRGRWWWRSPAEPPDWRAYVMSISISPNDPNLIVAGIEFGAMIRSLDGGKTWSNHLKGALRDCHKMTFHASNGAWVYEAGGGGAAVSNNCGAIWRQPKSGLDRKYGWACAADPERPEVWYLAASGMPNPLKGQFEPPAHVYGKSNAAIYRSSGGAAWEKLSGGLPEPLDYMASALVTDPQAPGHIYAGLANGDVWHSADYGDSWARLPLNLGAHLRTLVLS
jgi:photosystem II stability/assembly factor-like uncharacterized protein